MSITFFRLLGSMKMSLIFTRPFYMLKRQYKNGNGTCRYKRRGKKRIVFFFTYYATAESKLNSLTIDVTATATTYGLSHNEITAAAAVTVCALIWQRS